MGKVELLYKPELGYDIWDALNKAKDRGCKHMIFNDKLIDTTEKHPLANYFKERI